MGDVFRSIVIANTGSKSADQISGFHLGVVIVVSFAFMFPPIELFLVEIWPRHGFSSLLLLGAGTVAGAVFAYALPDSYYRIGAFERSGRLYEYLGIRWFKRLTPNGDYVNRLIRQSQPAYRVIANREAIAAYEWRTRCAEACHFGGLWLSIPCAAYALLLDWNYFALWMLVPNIPFHIYPILLQRYTRARIAKLRL